MRHDEFAWPRMIDPPPRMDSGEGFIQLQPGDQEKEPGQQKGRSLLSIQAHFAARPFNEYAGAMA
jgi:hypothetical protein